MLYDINARSCIKGTPHHSPGQAESTRQAGHHVAPEQLPAAGQCQSADETCYMFPCFAAGFLHCPASAADLQAIPDGR